MTCRPRRITRASLLVAALVGGLAVPALAPASARAEDGTAGLARLVLASRLAEWGRADRNPLALIVAAGIRNQVALKRIERLPEGGATSETAFGTETTVESLLTEALAMAPKDEALAALAADVAATRTKGRVDGKGESVATVRGAGTDWYRKVSFEGTRYAEAYVELIGDGRLGVSVYDGQGNLVCRDPTPSVVTYCGWQPSATERYDVKVENLGTRPVRYKIATN